MTKEALDYKRCDVLPLVLKGKWYDMIDREEKSQEYRTSRTVTRQIDRWWGRCRINGSIPLVEFRRGYARNAPRMTWHVGAVVRCVISIHPEWGEPDGPHYLIQLDGRQSETKEGAK